MSHSSQHTPPLDSPTSQACLKFHHKSRAEFLAGMFLWEYLNFGFLPSQVHCHSFAPQIQWIKLLNWLGWMNQFPFVITLMLAHLTIPSPRITKLSTTPILSLPERHPLLLFCLPFLPYTYGTGINPLNICCATCSKNYVAFLSSTESLRKTILILFRILSYLIWRQLDSPSVKTSCPDEMTILFILMTDNFPYKTDSA